jgi:hypothetical protein
MKSRKARLLADHIACMGDIRNVYNFLIRTLKGKDTQEPINGDIIIM